MLAAKQPFSFVLFGASGHLASQKLYPALYVLALKKRLPENFAIVGFARTEMTDDSFRALVGDAIKNGMLGETNQKVLDDFLAHVHYHQGQYDDPKDFAALTKRLQTLEKGWMNPVRLSYLSIPPMVFATVIENICAGKIPEGAAFRVIVEKPVGHDMKSFEMIRDQLMKCFGANEVFLLDHYLGKEAVRNVYYLRFANPVLERLFKNTLINRVEITASEPGGIEERAGYFEHTGTLRDMFQSHLLQIASLLTMRIHGTEAMRESRLDALRQFYIPPATELNEVILQGQYERGAVNGKEVPGYREESGVDRASRTNTFIAMKLLSRTARWQGVPFYLRSGKRLAKKETRISIQFQVPHPVGQGSGPNRLDIILQGEAGMRMWLQTKLGGEEPKFRPLVLEDPLVCIGDCLPEHGQLLLEAIHGVEHWFPTFDEVQTSWRLIDPLQTHLNHSDTTLHMYAAGSKGPVAMDEWIAHDGVSWLE
jgi:glucose-6-phosphate 1-dehydrogenase